MVNNTLILCSFDYDVAALRLSIKGLVSPKGTIEICRNAMDRFSIQQLIMAIESDVNDEHLCWQP